MVTILDSIGLTWLGIDSNMWPWASNVTSALSVSSFRTKWGKKYTSFSRHTHVHCYYLVLIELRAMELRVIFSEKRRHNPCLWDNCADEICTYETETKGYISNPSPSFFWPLSFPNCFFTPKTFYLGPYCFQKQPLLLLFHLSSLNLRVYYETASG